MTVAPAPDPDRLGGWEWTKRTHGILNSRERRRLLGAIASTQARYLARRISTTLGRGGGTPDPGELAPPDSRFARAAEAAGDEQPATLVAHAYRTWTYGRALAAIDGVEIDDELFYAGCLLHDHGVTTPRTGEDFTLRSARRALCCNDPREISAERADLLVDAITVHTTPGISTAHDGALGVFIQTGAMVDLIGDRLWDLPAAVVDRTLARWNRQGFVTDIAELIHAEARAVPGGRFSLLHRCGFVPFLKVAPFRP